MQVVGTAQTISSTFLDSASMAHLRGTTSINSLLCEDHVTITRLSLITEN
jgi:hypothetical protein